MWGVVGPEADGEYYQGAKRQTDGAQPPTPTDVWKTGEDADEVDVAETADQKGDAEEDDEELQAHPDQDVELISCEFQVAGGWRRGRAVAPLRVGYDVDDAEVQTRHQPEHDAGQHRIARPAAQGVPEGEGDPQVALHAHGSEEQGAVVDGHVEHEAGKRTQGVGQQPGHVVWGLLHFKRQEGEEDQVGDGQVEEEDVYRGSFTADFPAEGAECQDVGGDPHQKGEDVESEQQATV